MASFTKRRDGRWQVRVRRKGYPQKCATFRTKAEAECWASEIESQMGRRVFKDTSKAESMTVSDMLDRFQEEVLFRKDNYTSDPSRLKNIKRHLGDYALINVTPEVIATFRNERLRIAIPEDADQATRQEIEEKNKKERRVGPASVTREMNILSTIMKHALSEWGIHLPYGNPVSMVRRPRKPRSRERRTDERELERLAAHSESPQLLDLCLFAVETAMRRGEIAAARWEHIDLRQRRLHIPHTKTDKPRTIPLTRRAVEILMRRPRRDDGYVWGIRADSITRVFNRARDRAGIKDLHFHDLRHEATSRFFELGLDDMKVAKITGHKDWRSLERYTHLRPDGLAEEIDRAQDRRNMENQQWNTVAG